MGSREADENKKKKENSKGETRKMDGMRWRVVMLKIEREGVRKEEALR